MKEKTNKDDASLYVKRSKGNAGIRLRSIVSFLTPDNLPLLHVKMLGGELCYNKVMKHNHFIVVSSLLGLAGLILILNITSPVEIGPLGVLFFFAAFYTMLFGVTTFLLKLFYRLALGRTVFRNKDYLYAVVMAFGPVMLLMARSLGAVSVWVIGLIGVFLFLVEFLIYKKL